MIMAARVHVGWIDAVPEPAQQETLEETRDNETGH